MKQMNDLFAKRLKELRLKSGLTQIQFAEKIDVSVTQLSNYENGKRMPSLDTFIKMCLVLNKPAECFLNIEKENTSLSDEQLRRLEEVFASRRGELTDAIVRNVLAGEG